MSEPLRWGVIGTGAIAAAWVEDMGMTDSGSVVAVGSRKLETAERFAERFGIPNRHASYEQLVADADVNAVYVATPHPLHSPCAQLALRAGKPALVEKPFTVTAAEAQELVALARAEGQFLMEAMWTRWLPHIVAIRQFLAEGRWGRSSSSRPTTANGSHPTATSGCTRASSPAARWPISASTRCRLPRWCWARPSGSSV